MRLKMGMSMTKEATYIGIPYAYVFVYKGLRAKEKGLVSLFNGISNFVGYLVPQPFS